jgi:Tol biopolymer transport system component
VARTAIVIFLIFGALMPTARSPARSPSRVRNGLIVYTASDSQGRAQVFTVSPDGTGAIGARQLTSSAGQCQYPAWSSDGRRIAFSSSRTGNPELWTMHADGSHQRQLTRSPMVGGFVPSWSPDGRHIAFSAMSGNPAHPEIWTVDADGRNPRQLTVTSTPIGSNAPSWSPDGRRIAFASDRSGVPEVYTMRPDGTGVRQLTQPTAPLYPSANVPVWSPDGAHLLFWSGVEALFGQVWIMGADGSKRRALTSCVPPTNCDDPAWSPDGRFVLFDRTPLVGLAAGTWVMDADGSREHLLLPFPYGAGRRPWQPVSNR